MQKLHLVGITTDQEGLILSARRNARSGGYVLVVDDALMRAVDDLRTRQAEEAEARGVTLRSDRVESRLPVSEMQARLRRGRTLKDVAKDAGVDQEWVERFAAPVFAEMAQVISRVRNTPLVRQRLGPSGMRIGDAVRRNLVERGVVMAPSDFDAAWTTHQRPDGRWLVRFTFHYRGATKTLRYDVVEPAGPITAGDALTGQLSYVTPTVKRTPRPKPVKTETETAASKRAVVSTGFRAESTTSKPVSRPAKERERAAAAMNKAVAKRALEGERAAARKAKERAAFLARREREERADQMRRERERVVQVRAAAAAARAEALAQAERDRVAAVAAAARQAEREAARRAAREKASKQGASGAGKRAAAKSTPAKATASTRKASPPARATTAAKVKPKPAPPRPEARVDAPAPPRRRPAAAPAPTPDPEPTTIARAPRPAPERPTRPERARTERPKPEAPEAEPTRSAGLSGAAVDVYGPEATRALFRAGLVEQASDARKQSDAAPRPAAANGAEAMPRKRPPGARRTRPLRAN